MQAHEKLGKSRTCVFPILICGSGGSKSSLAKAAGAEPAGQIEMKNCTPLWREAHVEVKMIQNVQNTPGSEHFWLRCRSSVRRCGTKHISKSKCTKHIRFRPP